MANSVHGSEDRVTLILAGDTVVLCQRYQVKCAILTQPAIFSLTLGDNATAAKILASYPPNAPFQLKINDVVYQTGRTDACRADGPPAIVTVTGRDALAALHDDMVEGEESFKDVSYAQLVRKALDAAGLADAKLAYTNEANRKAITGGNVQQLQPPRDVELEKVEVDSGGIVKRETQAHLGERRYEFLRRHIDRAGLFLWAAGDGSFVLSEPNKNQNPLYALVRSQQKPFGSNIEHHAFANDATGRYAAFVVYARAATKNRRVPAIATVTDEEATAWGFKKRMVIKDTSADTPKKAEFIARRRMAETRRQGWRLSYTVRGHTTTAIVGGAGKKVAWAPDTVVSVYDQQLGFDGVNFYVEGVTFNGEPFTSTTLDLMRLDDLVFSDKDTSSATAVLE